MNHVLAELHARFKRGNSTGTDLISEFDKTQQNSCLPSGLRIEVGSGYKEFGGLHRRGTKANFI